MEQSSSEKINHLVIKVELDNNLGAPFYHKFSKNARNLFRLELSEIEDIWQNTFLKLISKNVNGEYRIDSYSYYIDNKTPLIDDKLLKPWLKKILFNASIDYHRSKNGRKNEYLFTNCDKEITEGFLESSSKLTPLEILIEKEDRNELENAINQLHESYKAVVHLIVYQQLKYREAAEILNIPEGTVKSRYCHAKHLLRRMCKNVA